MKKYVVCSRLQAIMPEQSCHSNKKNVIMCKTCSLNADDLPEIDVEAHIKANPSMGWDKLRKTPYRRPSMFHNTVHPIRRPNENQS